ncbi:hypothetical protein LY78DRAFT_95708 [Colletotrichum sublineola]|nr:hypothetical protein LY78DRAFT_95708 [Colletotrichum sublineola]
MRCPRNQKGGMPCSLSLPLSPVLSTSAILPLEVPRTYDLTPFRRVHPAKRETERERERERGEEVARPARSKFLIPPTAIGPLRRFPRSKCQAVKHVVPLTNATS